MNLYRTNTQPPITAQTAQHERHQCTAWLVGFWTSALTGTWVGFIGALHAAMKQDVHSENGRQLIAGKMANWKTCCLAICNWYAIVMAACVDAFLT